MRLINEKNKKLEITNKCLEKAKVEIEWKEKQKTDFFINISHEMKTPLTLIGNYLERDIAKRGMSREIIIVKKNMDRLLADIGNYLDFEKMQNGKAVYDHNQTIDLGKILKDKLILFGETARKKGIEMSHEIENGLYAGMDPYAFDRVVSNLLDNAGKYNNVNGRIDVTLKSCDRDKIRLEIRDTGIGISDENMANLFKAYYQASHPKLNIQGIGMGLNIVKKIVDEIGGKMEIKSKPNEGSSFIILFDRHELKDAGTATIVTDIRPYESPPADTGVKEEIFRKGRKNVFIVEDNPNMLDLFKESLNEKYNVFHSANGREALDKIKIIVKPDIIISDIMMDVMDGYDFCRNLFKMDEYRNVPLIFLTAKTTHEDKLKGLAEGAIDFISKPFDMREIMAKIDSIIGLKEALLRKRLEEISGKLLEKMNLSSPKTYQERLEILHKKYNISERQLEILSLVNEGLISKEIAGRLKISKNTVDTHLKRIFDKLGIDSKYDLIKILENPSSIT